MSNSLVKLTRDGEIATVTLNRPETLNALSQGLIQQLSDTFEQLQRDKTIAVVILTGSGKGFCSGLDLKELSKTGLNNFMQFDSDFRATINNFDRPIIGAINGVAATGGFELALWCDMLIASTQAKFIDTHTHVGLVSGWGLSQLLQRIIGLNRARELHFTGNPLNAVQAERWGLVNRVVEPEQLLTTCQQLAMDMASCDRNTLIRMKRVITDGSKMPLGAALDYETLAMDFHGASLNLDSAVER